MAQENLGELAGGLDDFTKARLEVIAPSKQVLLTFTNRVRLDFAKTWVTHVRGLKMSNWLIGATDQQALEGLMAWQYPCFNMKTNLPQGEWPWGSPSFKALGPHKIELIYKTISWGFEVMRSPHSPYSPYSPYSPFSPYLLC